MRRDGVNCSSDLRREARATMPRHTTLRSHSCSRSPPRCVLLAGLTPMARQPSGHWRKKRPKKRGAQISLEWDYAEPFPHDWHSVLLANAGLKPTSCRSACR